nr:MAG TPA: Endodeoxyribonuclease RusA [Caudoviricetes sp.]
MTQSLVVDVPASEWVSANSRLHWRERARRVRALRARGFWLARAAHLAPVGGRALVVARIHSRARRWSDPNNANPATKPLLDGLVDAGIFEDDDHTRVIGPHHLYGDPIPGLPTGGHRIVFEIREVEQ